MQKDLKKKYRVNEQIKAKEVRLIDPNGKQIGIVPLSEALRYAEDYGLDLVEIAPTANPPVCKIMDFGEFLYQEAKKAKEAKKKQKQIEIKEIKLSPKTDKHDLEVKIRHILRFLEDENKVRIRIVFKGREIAHPEMADRVLQAILEAVKDKAQIESPPKIEGKQMITVIAPILKK
ncbi:Translation initiation factor IF-3 [Thermodesulfobacterium geofontis OPF15]|jgi:translation initiation factor IF-3|uniref:Translation initiation factor IF-3 n=1 Tax=Thermodesulfobacterium geofontis (strain OPF15) TaxID=795359 RepID=F8C506_THEGP|nr:translation initiation factor IF-3 [Thermodesulfobacterium geofontis]AEH22791.1 Translation initiation factor IF-3 [Thermodesulfobacterium geofontis OPF15]